ncbi:hypothetical protein BS47DRAFT_1487772 [Hydnum rufescens UP504]|uniref:Uncharacterized protein n=1 Tax=Hydnum rufescens UP504 TaxID=1448309 RepID=A0A9P6AQ43_9AGAM|nr:hypothetical protein BS47DRAFT_1487772 [Hydnum rufescens UP504]
MESSSDWNSLLLTARAQRGPQWDVVTQQFMVDHNSGVYYDSTPLLAIHKEKEKERVRSVAGQQVQARQDAAHFTVASQMHQNQPQHQSIMLEAAGSYRDLLQTTYPYSNGNIPASPAGTTGNGYGSDTPYIPPEALRNPRRTTRGLNGREGMYRV